MFVGLKQGGIVDNGKQHYRDVKKTYGWLYLGGELNDFYFRSALF